MSRDFYRKVAVYPRKLDRSDEDTKRDDAIRLYCAQSDSVWHLQTRGTLRLSDGRPSKDFVYSTASLEKPDLRALRNACDDALHEYDDVREEGPDEASLSELAALLFDAANGARIPKTTWLEWAEELKKRSLR